MVVVHPRPRHAESAADSPTEPMRVPSNWAASAWLPAVLAVVVLAVAVLVPLTVYAVVRAVTG